MSWYLRNKSDVRYYGGLRQGSGVGCIMPRNSVCERQNGEGRNGTRAHLASSNSASADSISDADTPEVSL